MLPKLNKQDSNKYAIEGELNMQTVPAISKQLVELIPAIAGDKIVLDLESVSRSDSAGVALLVEAMQLAKKANLSLHFTNLPQQMSEIAKLSGLLEILGVDNI